ncbi:MAG TPA: hypothetical protein VGC79_10285 [Polyangiaceae bacterium]
MGQPLGASLPAPAAGALELSPPLSLLLLLLLRLPPLSLLSPPLLAPAFELGVPEFELLPQAVLNNADPKTNKHPSESALLKIAMHP